MSAGIEGAGPVACEIVGVSAVGAITCSKEGIKISRWP